MPALWCKSTGSMQFVQKNGAVWPGGRIVQKKNPARWPGIEWPSKQEPDGGGTMKTVAVVGQDARVQAAGRQLAAMGLVLLDVPQLYRAE